MRSFSLLVLLLRLTGFFHSLPWGLSWSYISVCMIFVESPGWNSIRGMQHRHYVSYFRSCSVRLVAHFPLIKWMGSDRLRRGRSDICLIPATSSGVVTLKDSVMPWDKVSLSHVNVNVTQHQKNMKSHLTYIKQQIIHTPYSHPCLSIPQNDRNAF